MDFPSFFKYIVHDSSSTLRIPMQFVNRYEEILPQHALLKTTKSGRSELNSSSWSVQIEQIDGRYCFTHGWPEFVNDLKLQIGDLLVFWLIIEARSVFKVAIYEVGGCEKEFIINNSATNNSTTHCPILKVHDHPPPQPCADQLDPKNVHTVPVPKSSATSSAHGGKNRRLKKKIANHSRRRKPYPPRKSYPNTVEDGRFTKHIPLRFAKKTGIMGKKEVELRYENGSSTTVGLKHFTNPIMVDMCGGWPEFRQKNGLLYGKNCAFEYIPEADCIQVQLLDQDRN